MGRISGQRLSRRTILTLGLLATLPWALQDAGAASKTAAPKTVESKLKPGPKVPALTPLQASARLGFDLISEMSKNDGTDPNPVVSPASLTAAFSVLDLGASPKFHRALLKTLRLDGAGKDGDLATLRQSLAPLLGGSKAESPLTGISAVYFDPQAEPRPAALKALQAAGVQAEIRDLTDGATLAVINGLVNERTKGLIPTIIDDPLQKGGLVVVNALHFKDEWRFAFDPSHTVEVDFQRAGSGAAKVAMMQGASISQLVRQDGRFVAVSLPYEGKGYHLVLVTTNDKPAALAEFAPVAGWLTGEGFGAAKGTVSLPRLSIRAGGDLRDSLDKLGLAPAVLAPDVLRQFSTKPQKIDKIIQKVVVTIDEKGTEAAAATAVTSRSLAEPAAFSFVADKPFLFALLDETSGQILTTGYIGDASKAQ